MSLDSSDFYPPFCLHKDNPYDDAQGYLDITKVPDAELKEATAYMVKQIRYYFGGHAIGPDDDHAAHYIKYMRFAIGQWEWVLDEIERRWKIKHFESDDRPQSCKLILAGITPEDIQESRKCMADEPDEQLRKLLAHWGEVLQACAPGCEVVNARQAAACLAVVADELEGRQP
jgi:hypothetical protein